MVRAVPIPDIDATRDQSVAVAEWRRDPHSGYAAGNVGIVLRCHAGHSVGSNDFEVSLGYQGESVYAE